MNKARETVILSLLIDVEANLRSAGFWDSEQPSEEALSSTEPFCIDSLEFYQWIQWIFIPKLRGMIEQGVPLPEVSGIAPLAAEWSKMKGVDASDLILLLERIDTAMTIASD